MKPKNIAAIALMQKQFKNKVVKSKKTYDKKKDWKKDLDKKALAA